MKTHNINSSKEGAASIQERSKDNTKDSQTWIIRDEIGDEETTDGEQENKTSERKRYTETRKEYEKYTDGETSNDKGKSIDRRLQEIANKTIQKKPCQHHKRGNCKFGNRCWHSHEEKVEECRFGRNCRFGRQRCWYGHPNQTDIRKSNERGHVNVSKNEQTKQGKDPGEEKEKQILKKIMQLLTKSVKEILEE